MKATGIAAMVGLASSSASGAAEGDKGRKKRNKALPRNAFEVSIDGEDVRGWKEIKLPARRTEEQGGDGNGEESQERREGNDASHEKKTWGQPTFDDLEMERGLYPDDTRLFDWRAAVEAGKADEGRKEIAVKLLDEEGEVQLQWEFREAWIKEYSPPELDASADGDVATESITVAFDRMKREEV